MMTIARVKVRDGEAARVVFDEDWQAFDWQTPAYPKGGVGPFDTAEEAGEALADELDDKVASDALDDMIDRCRLYDSGA